MTKYMKHGCKGMSNVGLLPIFIICTALTHCINTSNPVNKLPFSISGVAGTRFKKNKTALTLFYSFSCGISCLLSLFKFVLSCTYCVQYTVHSESIETSSPILLFLSYTEYVWVQDQKMNMRN